MYLLGSNIINGSDKQGKRQADKDHMCQNYHASFFNRLVRPTQNRFIHIDNSDQKPTFSNVVLDSVF